MLLSPFFRSNLWNKCISSRLRVYGKCLDPETCGAQIYKVAKVIKKLK